MKIKLAIIFILGIYMKAIGQEHAAIRSPQVSDMIRYNTTSVAKASGRLDLNINLLGINDADFQMPVSLSYNSSGYVPSKPESSVGLNWSLVTGGAIYREVRGMPDDWEDDNSDLHEQGFLAVMKGHNVCSTDQLWQSPGQYLKINEISRSMLIKGTTIESAPDIYHFSFGSYSGKFTFNFDGTVNVVANNGGKLKVDVSGYNYYSLNNTSTIKIMTDDGYIYCFGGSKDNIEYTLSYNPDSKQVYNIHNYYISSFHLSQIIAPNGRSLYIKYHGLNSKYHNPYELFRFDNRMSDTDAMNYTLSNVFSASLSSDVPSMEGGTFGFQQISHRDTSYLFIKSALVEEISTDCQKIKFFYSLKGFNPYNRKEIANSWKESCGAKLDSICLIDNQGKRCRKLLLGYSWLGGIYQRAFLTKLHVSEHEVYNFNYNVTTLPDPFTCSIDYWNYWQKKPWYGGLNPNTTMIPVMHLNTNGDSEYATQEREPGWEGFDTGLLRKMTYPSGGYSEFYYEPHTYSSIVERNSTSDFLPVCHPTPYTMLAGGARVSKIIDHSGNTPITRGFEYTKSKSDRTSSGTLTYFPKYGCLEWHYFVVMNGKEPILYKGFYVKLKNVGMNLRAYEADHVLYSHVTEVMVESESKVNPEHLSFAEGPLTDINPMRKVLSNVSVGEQWEDWTFYGAEGANYNGNAQASFYFKKAGSETVFREFQVFPDKWNHGYLMKQLPPGKYDIYCFKKGSISVGLHVSYPNIGQTKYSGAYQTSIYSDYFTNPDNVYDDYLPEPITNNPGELPTIYEKNYQRLSQDRSVERWKLLNEKFFDRDGKIIRENTYQYSRNSSYDSKFSLFGRFMFSTNNQLCKEYFYTYDLIGKKQQEYKDGNILNVQQNYSYDINGYLKESSVVSSDGKKHRTDYIYPFDLGTQPVYSEMVNRNILSPIVEENMLVDSKLVHRKRNEYTFSQNIPVISTVLESSGGELEARMFYNKYNSKGRLTSFSKDNSVNIVHVWGYNHQYIIAEVSNASVSEVESVLGDLEAFSSSVAPDFTKISQLRTSLPNALVTSCTYIPLIGISTITDPRGIITYYEYDSAGKLRYVKDQNKQILNYYEYNYNNK